MKIIQIFSVTALFIFGFVSLACAQEVLTLDKAYELARENSPQIMAQKYAIEAAEAQASEAKYYWTPKFEFKSEFGPMPKSKDITESENDIWDHFLDSWGFTTRNYLDFWFPVFTSTKVYHTNQLAKIGLEVEQLRAQNEILNVEYDVARAYIGLQFANAARDVIKEAESYVDRIESEYQKLLENGSTAVKETDQYKIDIARAKLLRLKNEVEAKRDYAERALSVHTRLSLPIQIEEMNFDNVSDKLQSCDQMLEIAKNHRGDLMLLESAERAAALEAKIQWLDWWPDFVIAGEVYYKYSNAVPKYDADNFYIKDGYNGHGFGIGFMIRWNLDPVRQVFKVRQADAKAERMRAQRQLAISGIELEVAEQCGKTLNDLNNISIIYKSRRSAKRFLTNELLNYEAGEGNVSDMINALTTFIEQRSMYLQALHDYHVSLVKLQKVTGIEDPRLLLEPGESL